MSYMWDKIRVFKSCDENFNLFCMVEGWRGGYIEFDIYRR